MISSKGQLVIPKTIRNALGVRPGTRLQVQLLGHKIVLEPVESLAPIEALIRKYADADFMTDLKLDRQQDL